MELRHLRYFEAVAEELHFGRAAQRLLMAQPPLSQQIRALEREMGVQLLVRSTRQVQLTPAGHAFLGRVRDVIAAVDDAVEEARRISSGLEGRLVIGCVGSATYSLLPHLARALRSALPGVDLRVRGEMLAPAQLAALDSGEIDIAILRPPVTDPNLAVELIRQDRLLVALPTDHALASQDHLTVTDLQGADFITHAGSGRSRMRDLLATLCASAGFAPSIRHEVDETSTLVTMVAAGLGVAVVPEPTSQLTLDGVCYRRLLPTTTIDLIAAYRTATDSPLITNTMAVLRCASALSGYTPAEGSAADPK